jgi:hypothetical protein
MTIFGRSTGALRRWIAWAADQAEPQPVQWVRTKLEDRLRGSPTPRGGAEVPPEEAPLEDRR